jgi:hypothetical protein
MDEFSGKNFLVPAESELVTVISSILFRSVNMSISFNSLKEGFAIPISGLILSLLQRQNASVTEDSDAIECNCKPSNDFAGPCT